MLIVCVVSSLIYIVDRIMLQKGTNWNHLYQFIHMPFKTIFKYLIYGMVGISIILLIIVLCSYFFGNFFSEETGYMGDTLGGTTAPFIGLLSIFLLFYTFKEQRDFNQKQKEFNDRQTQLTHDEQFKTTFFMLLQEQRDILKSLRTTCVTLKSSTTDKVHRNVQGQEFFAMAIFELRLLFKCMEMPTYQSGYNQEEATKIKESIYNQLYIGFSLPQELKEENEDTINDGKQIIWQKYLFDKFDISENEYKRYKTMALEERVEYVYSKFFCIYENCGYYFRHLYRLLKYIENSENEERLLHPENADIIKDKYLQYAEYIQSQMSTKEMLIVFYNCFLFEKSRVIIVKYELLQNLTKQNLLMEEHQKYAEEFKMKDRPNYNG